MQIRDLVAQCALTKKEAHLLEDLLHLIELHPSLEEGMIDGGVGTKIYIDPRYRHLNTRSWDIDMVFPELPADLLPHLRPITVIERERIVYKMYEVDITCVPGKFTGHNLYVPGYTDIDIAVGAIADIAVPEDVDPLIIPLQHDEGPERQIRFVHPGVLIATQLKPQGYKWQRANRARLLYRSFAEGSRFGYTLGDVEEVCAYVLKESGLVGTSTTDHLHRLRVDFASRDVPFRKFAERVLKG